MNHWFDENFYLQSKLAQLQADKVEGFNTVADVKAAIEGAGYTVEQHFNEYHSAELTSPNADFNTVEYINAKLATLDDSWTFDSLKDAMVKACGSVYDHYIDFGAFETSAADEHGINPCNSFDTELYLQEKVQQLNDAKEDGRSDWTVDQLIDALKAEGMTPIDHYHMFGEKEGLHEVAVPEDQQVSDHIPGTGETFTLTTGAEVLNGTDGDDVINGVSSSLSADRTLDQGDLIDGKDGNDTLNVNLDSSFGGFKDGDKAGMSNVENIVLNNEGNIQRSFDASGIKGAEKYVLNGEVSLNDLEEAGVTVELNGEQKDTSIGFTDAAVKGEEDSLNLVLNGVGHMEDDKIDSTSITANGIEEMNVTVKGDDYVNLKGDALKSMTLQGDGNVDLGKVEDTVKSFDSSALSGNVTVDLTEVEGLSSLVMGAGDDSIKADADTFTTTAVIDGGEGNNSLEIAAGGTVQPTLKNFQNVTLNSIDDNLTVSGKNISDLSSLTLKDGALENTDSLTIAKLEAPEFTLVEQGEQAGNIILSDDSALTVSTVATGAVVKAKADGTTHAANADITASHATDLTVNVGEYTNQNGTILASEAQSVTLNIASALNDDKAEQTSFSGSITAGKAQAVTVNAQGDLSGSASISAGEATEANITAAAGGNLNLNLAKAETVNIDADKDFDIKGSTLKSVQQLTVDSEGKFDASDVSLNNITNLTVTGLGNKASATFENLGSPSSAKAITVEASGLGLDDKDTSTTDYGLTLGTINSKGADVTLNFAELMATAKVSAIGTTGNVGNVDIDGGIKGMELSTINTVATADVDIDVNGGIFKVENIAVANESDGSLSGSININVDGAKSMTLGNLTASDVTVDAGEYLKTDVDLFSASKITADDLTFVGALKGNKVKATITDSVDFTGDINADVLDVTSVDNGVADKASALAINFSGDDGNDKLTIIDDDANGTVVTGTLDGGDGEDILDIQGHVDLSGAKISSFKELDLTKAAANVTMTTDQFNHFTINGADDKDTITFSDVAGTSTEAMSLAGDESFKLGDFDNYVKAADTTALTVIGGTGADHITGGAGDDTITGGAGADTINVGTGVDNVILGTVTAAGTDVVTGLGNDDFVQFFASTDYLDDTATDYSGETNLDAAIAKASAAAKTTDGTDSTGWAVTFEYGGKTYAYIDGATDGYDAGDDAVVELIGTDVASLTAANFIDIA